MLNRRFYQPINAAHLIILLKIMTTRILIVDNNKDSLEIIEQILINRLDCLIKTACSGRGALAQIERQAFDLLILDVMMPDIHGVEVCRLLTKNQRLSKPPVLLMSALPLSKTVSQTQQEINELDLVKEVLEKPFDHQELLDKVKAVLGNKFCLKNEATRNL